MGASAHSAGPGFFCLSVCGFVGLWVCGVVWLWCVCVLLAAWVPKSSKNLLRSPTSTKTEQKLDQNRPQMGPIWARGRGRGNRKSTKIWKSTKNAKVKKQNKKKLRFWNMVRFSQKTEGSTAGLYRCFLKKQMISRLYKTEHNETQQKHKNCQSPSKKWCFKKH